MPIFIFTISIPVFTLLRIGAFTFDRSKHSRWARPVHRYRERRLHLRGVPQ
jgi:hypothetical protein